MILLIVSMITSWKLPHDWNYPEITLTSLTCFLIGERYMPRLACSHDYNSSLEGGREGGRERGRVGGIGERGRE